MKIEKVKFEDVKGQIHIRGEHFEAYEAIKALKREKRLELALITLSLICPP